MIQVWLIDENGFYTGVMDFVENPNENEIPILPNGFYKPKWDGEKWTEGATQEEIDEINKIDICPGPTVEEQLLATQKMVLSLQEQIIDML